MSKAIRIKYLKYALTGIKSPSMTSIERRFPGVKGFTRWSCFMTVITFSFWYKNGWIMIFPVRQAFEFHDTQYAWSFNFGIIAGYISKYNRKVVQK